MFVLLKIAHRLNITNNHNFDSVLKKRAIGHLIRSQLILFFNWHPDTSSKLKPSKYFHISKLTCSWIYAVLNFLYDFNKNAINFF